MKKSLVYILPVYFLVTFSWGKNTIRNQILDLLPKELSSLTSKDLRKDIENKFSSKINKKDQPDTLYLNYFDEKNDVSIGTEGGKFSYLYAELPPSIVDENIDLYKSIVSQLSEEQKKKIIQEHEKKISHEKGRFIIIDLPEEGLKLEFLNVEKKPLHSVIVFPLEKK